MRALWPVGTLLVISVALILQTPSVQAADGKSSPLATLTHAYTASYTTVDRFTKHFMMMMIWALGRRNKDVIWRPYRLRMEDHLKIHKILRRGCLAISVDSVEEEEALLCIT